MLTRTRVDLKDTIGVGRNQVEGLTAVASDVFGVNDWAMLEKGRPRSDQEHCS